MKLGDTRMNLPAALNSVHYRSETSLFTVQTLTRHNAVQATQTSSHTAFVECMLAVAKLSLDEASLVRGLVRRTRAHSARAEIWDGTASSKPTIMVSGWACRQRFLGDGRRQIINFLLPGDAVGDWAQPGLHADTTSVALTSVVTADASDLVAAAMRRDGSWQGLNNLRRLMAARETAQLHDHIVRLGRQTAYERMAHIMLEFHARLRIAGLAVGDSLPMPLTQETLADSLGLSVVHVNRTLMQLRRDGLLDIRSGVARLLDTKLMQAVADWVPPQLDGNRQSA